MLCVATLASCSFEPKTQWPKSTIEAKPGSRWWWLGSAVDSANITKLMEMYAEAGMGAMEITPIYGVQGNDANDIPFLSERWMNMLSHTEAEAKRLGMVIDMNTGTGWPFGGPSVSLDDAARKMVVERRDIKGGEVFSDTLRPSDKRQRDNAELVRVLAFGSNGEKLDLTASVDSSRVISWTAPQGEWRLYVVYCGHTYQKVKRAAPGGEGYVMNHFSRKAVDNYLGRFTEAFKQNATAVPHNFFNDSYEVYGADCTADIFEQFSARRGYALEDYFEAFLSDEKGDTISRVKSDYCETLSELLLENFTSVWTDWAHDMGSSTRNQAHGSPANLIDIYAAVDIPECEGFGLSNFGIKGLRYDSLTRKNDSDLSMLKYASSAAHITGKKYVSSETFTWLTEHFRTSLSQCKPDLDLMFVSGVNHIYFHGTTYSPAEAEWPGWKFYASIDMSPTNTIWKDAKGFFKYIERSQSFLQMGAPDNDFLVYLPIYDIWYEQSERLLQLTIHDMAHRAPEFIKVINSINSAGYDVDYISDKYILTSAVTDDGKISTEGGANYKAIVVPSVNYMPADVALHLLRLAQQGATIIFSENYPLSSPGMKVAEMPDFPEADFAKIHVSHLGDGKIITGTDYAELLAKADVEPEQMKCKYGLQAIRRTNATGHHYFVSNLTPNDVDAEVELAVDVTSAMFFDPMTGNKGKAKINNGKIRLQLASGESIIIKTFAAEDVDVTPWKYDAEGEVKTIDTGWSLRFTESDPQVTSQYDIDNLTPWTALEDSTLKIVMGTACYKVNFTIDKQSGKRYRLSLGDVRESAKVRLNNSDVMTLWAVPYECDVTDYLHNGDNCLEVYVTNMPANRIAQMDRDGVQWRKFKEINIVDIHYKKTGYGHWDTVTSGLVGPVTITEQ